MKTYLEACSLGLKYNGYDVASISNGKLKLYPCELPEDVAVFLTTWIQNYFCQEASSDE